MTTLAELSIRMHDLELKEYEALPRSGLRRLDLEASYIAAWTEMLFSLLTHLAEGDEEEVERLTQARRWFNESMAALHQRPGSRIVYWQRMLAARLAYLLPDALADQVPVSVWDSAAQEVEVTWR